VLLPALIIFGIAIFIGLLFAAFPLTDFNSLVPQANYRICHVDSAVGPA
jgi:hypothetical protein